MDRIAECMPMAIWAGLCGLILTCLGGALSSAEEPPSPAAQGFETALKRNDMKLVMGAEEARRVQREQIETLAVSILESSRSDMAQKCKAAFVLSRYGGAIAVPALLENIMLRNPEYMKVRDEKPMIPEYPCRDALIMIGILSIDAATQLAVVTDDEDIRRSCIDVVLGVFDRRLQGWSEGKGVAIEWLKKKAAGVDNEERRSAILNELKKRQPEAGGSASRRVEVEEKGKVV